MINLTRILAGVLIAAALLLAAYAWTLSRRPARPAPHPAPIVQAVFPVVVAARRLVAGQPIERGALRIERFAFRPQGTFAEPSLLAKRVPLADIGPGVPVFEAQLSSGFAEQVEPGKRAVAVHVDEASAVGDRLRPGNFVDVFVTLKRENAAFAARAEVPRTQTKLLLSHLRVLAFGNTVAGGGNGADRSGHPRTAVLAVPAADVDRLALADSAGRLVLALRNPREAQAGGEMGARERAGVAAESAGVSLAALAAADGVRTARPRPKRARTGGHIEVIRAGRAQTLDY